MRSVFRRQPHRTPVADRVAETPLPMPASGSSPSANHRVAIVEDHPIFRQGLLCWLARTADLVCCGWAASIASAMSLVSREKPDLVLLGLKLLDGDGMDLLRALVRHPEAPRFLIVSQKDEMLYAPRAIREGARGYVMKTEPPEVVLKAIRTVLNGGIHLSPDVADRVLQSAVSHRGRHGSPEQLTEREREVLGLMGQALSVKDIASALGISFKTVDSHRESIKRKLGLGDGASLVRYATLMRLEGWTHVAANGRQP